MTRIAIISGSQRINGNSGRIAEFVAGAFKAQLGFESYILDLAKSPLPLWDEGTWGAEAPEGYSFTDWGKVWGPIAEELKTCDGVVILAPEYNGTAPAALKNFLHIAGSGEGTLAHKAGLLMSVSAGGSGAYPIAEMRMAATKNCKINIMPDHLIIRQANDMFLENAPEQAAEADAYIRERLTFTLDVFAEYVKALNGVRASGKAKNKKFAYGM